MIPKIIHYVWVGNKEKDDLALACINSWKKYFPDFELMEWNNSNIPIEVKYVSAAYESKNWSNVSNFIRLHALLEYGGIYFDTDFEAIKSFDFLDSVQVFLGYENNDPLVNSAVLGGVKNHLFFKDCMEYLLKHFDGLEQSNLSGPVLATEVLKNYGLENASQQIIQDITIFPEEYFYPYPWNKPFVYACVSETTYGIHYWAKSWEADKSQLAINQLLHQIEENNLNSKNTLFIFKTVLKVFINKIKNKVKQLKS